MALQYSILACALIGYSIAYPFSLPGRSDSTLGSLLENVKGVDPSNLLASFRLPPCVQQCADETGNPVASLDFGDGWSIEKTKVICGQFEAMKACIAKKPTCSSIVVEIGMHSFDFLCTDDEATVGLIPCVRREALKIHGACEKACKLGATLMDAASLDTRRTDSLNFIDENGNKILSVPDLHVLCNTSTCFLSCMKTRVDEKCPHGGSELIDNVLASLMRRVTMTRFLPETKVLDAYASLISSVLPGQCQLLAGEYRDIVLTTPGEPFEFIPGPHDAVSPAPLAEAPFHGSASRNGYPDFKTKNDEASMRKIASEEGAAEGKTMENNVGSVSGAVLPFLVTVMLFAARLQF